MNISTVIFRAKTTSPEAVRRRRNGAFYIDKPTTKSNEKEQIK